jgi:hypothetical protein
MNLREYIDSLKVEGYTVRDDHGDDPVLISPDGRAVETWKQDLSLPLADVAQRLRGGESTSCRSSC